MNELIKKLADESGLRKGQHWNKSNMDTQHIIKFVELIQAGEREACAKLCETNMFDDPLDLADAIRSRGEVK